MRLSDIYGREVSNNLTKIYNFAVYLNLTVRNFRLFLSAVLLCAALLPAREASCREDGRTISAGLTTLLRGTGLSAEIGLKDREYCRLSIYAEMPDMIFSGSPFPGIKANWTHSYNLPDHDCGTFKWSFHAGPGISAGYVRNFSSQWGPALALSGNAGFIFRFREDFVIDLSWTAELGGHLVRSGNGNTILTFYLPGIQRAIYPELKLLYRFR